MTTDAQARQILVEAYAEQGLPSPSVAELQLAAAVARLESHYGDAWSKRVQPNPHNWGNVTCGHRAPCAEGCFEAPDSDPDTGKYASCFRRYPSAVAGAGGMLHELYRREGVPDAMRRGDAHAMAAAMYDTGYYRGFGPTRAERVAGYTKGLVIRRQAVAETLGEPVATGEPLNPPVAPPLRRPRVPPARGPGVRTAAFGAGVICAGAAVYLWRRPRG